MIGEWASFCHRSGMHVWRLAFPALPTTDGWHFVEEARVQLLTTLQSVVEEARPFDLGADGRGEARGAEDVEEVRDTPFYDDVSDTARVCRGDADLGERDSEVMQCVAEDGVPPRGPPARKPPPPPPKAKPGPPQKVVGSGGKGGSPTVPPQGPPAFKPPPPLPKAKPDPAQQTVCPGGKVSSSAIQRHFSPVCKPPPPLPKAKPGPPQKMLCSGGKGSSSAVQRHFSPVFKPPPPLPTFKPGPPQQAVCPGGKGSSSAVSPPAIEMERRLLEDNGDASLTMDRSACLSSRWKPELLAGGTHADVPQGTMDYDILNFLGRGSYGCVHLARCHRSSGLVALKVQDLCPAALEEVHKMRRLCHPHIVDLHTAFRCGTVVVMVMEACRGDLANELAQRSGRRLVENECRELFRQLLDAVIYLQAGAEQIIHRDIKPANVLLGHDGVAKLSDFGLAVTFRAHGVPRFDRSGTDQYEAPEMRGDAGYNTKVDNFALGVTLFELLVGKRPFGIGRDSRNRGLKEQICSDPVPVSLCLTRAARSLVKALWKKRPDRRARLKTARRFSFFNANANRPAGQEAAWTVQVAEGKQGGISDAMHIHVQDNEILRTTRGCSVLLPAPPNEAVAALAGASLASGVVRPIAQFPVETITPVQQPG